MGHTDGWSRGFPPHPTVAPPFSRGITSPRHWGWHFHKARRPLGSNVDLYNYDSHSIWDFLGKIHEIPRGFFMVFAHHGWSRGFPPHPTVAPPFSRGITSPRHWGWHFHKARRPLGSNVDLYNYDSHSIWDFLGKIHEIPRGFFMVFAHQCGQMKCDIFKLMFLKNKKHISSHPIFLHPFYFKVV